MQRTLLTVAAIAIIGSLGSSATRAAELGSRPVLQGSADRTGPPTALYGCRRVRTCDAYGCAWHHECPTSCPSPYSCYPLYGAYGPFGGTPYWGAYTEAGWGYRHW